MFQENINSGRQLEFDIAKFLVVINLAPIHSVIECSTDEVLAHGFPFFYDSVLGGPLAAPMFLFAMGVGFVYSKRDSAKGFFYRGLKLLLVGFVLNILRFFLPFITGYLITHSAEQYIEPLWYRVFGNDVLQFASLSLILMALLKALKLPDLGILLTAVIMRIAGIFLSGFDANNQILNVLLGHFIAVEDSAEMVFSDFPLLNWFIVPASGYIFGKKLISCSDADKKKLYMILSVPCLIFAVIWFTKGIINASGMFDEGQNSYYHMGIADTFASICAVLALLGIYNLFAAKLPERVLYLIVQISRATTHVYFIQWVLVMWLTDFLLYVIRGNQFLPQLYSILLGYLISLISVGFALFIRKKSIQGK